MIPGTRRAANLLGLSWAVAWIGVPVSGAFASVIVLQLTNDPRWTGVPFFLLYVGTLLSAYPAGHLMDRYGRRPVLVGGHLLAAFGFVVGTMGILGGNLWVFLGGHLVTSIGASTTYLTRLAAADLYPAAERARGLGRLVFFLVFGALGGIPLMWLAQRLEGPIGQSHLAIAWAMMPPLSLIAAWLVWQVRPDPKEIAHQIQALEPPPTHAAARTARGIPVRTVVTAAAALLFAQAAMATVMSVTGASLEQQHHTPNYIVGTLTAHIFAMFGFSPILGVVGDRWGRRPLLLASGAYLVGATGATMLAPVGYALTVSLFAIGIGWSCAFLGATAIVADSVPAARRGRVTGIIDVCVALVGGTASLLAGGALDLGGIQRVAGLGLLFSLGVLVAASFAPGMGSHTRKVPSLAPVTDNLGK